MIIGGAMLVGRSNAYSDRTLEPFALDLRAYNIDNKSLSVDL